MSNTYTTETIKEVRTRTKSVPTKVIITWRDEAGFSQPFSIEVTTLDDTPVSAEVLQNMKIGEVIKQARSRNSNRSRLSHDEIAQKLTSRAGKKTSQEQLEMVASLYMEAYEQGLPVQQYVSERIGRPRSTTTKMLILARKQGLIPNDINKRRLPRVMPRVSQQ